MENDPTTVGQNSADLRSETLKEELHRHELASEALFQKRQRLVHHRLAREEGEGLTEKYLALRAEEQEEEYHRLRLANQLEAVPRVFNRSRGRREPTPPRLRIWVNVLMIAALAGILLLLMWTP